MRKLKFKLLALMIAAFLIAPLLIACGEEDTGSQAETNAPGGTAGEEAQTEAADPVAETPQTAEPTEPEPEPEPEPELEPIDPNLPYYEYLDEEFRRFGFTGGDHIAAGTEEEIMDVLGAKNCAKTAVDLSGQDVPFGYAFRYTTDNEPENFWDIAAELNYSDSKTVTEGDILAGVVWIRDAGGENPSVVHLAMKTPTNGWSGEGDMSVGRMEAPAEWKKIYFNGEFPVDEPDASQAIFTFFLGFEPHSIEIGGLYMMRFPSTSENIRATSKMPW